MPAVIARFTPLLDAISLPCPSRLKPVTSVAACTPPVSRRVSAARRFSVSIDSMAAPRSSSRALPSLAAVTTMPVPSRFVRKSRSPGCAPAFVQNPCGCTTPVTTSPNFGSGSTTVCPPAISASASATFAAAPARIWPITSAGRSSGNAATFSAKSTLPPMA